ncbi:MAG: AraC family transcriptional regulator [Pseudomonadota bacterium]
MSEIACVIPDELIQRTLQWCSQEGLHDTPLASLQIARSNHITERIHNVYKPYLCFIVQGKKEILVANQQYSYSSTQYLVTSIDLPVSGQVTQATPEQPYLCLVLTIEPNLIYEIITALNLAATAPHPLEKGFFVEQVKPDLTDAFLRLMRTLEDKNDCLILAPAIIREILYRLLTSTYGGVIQQLGIAGSQTQRIAKAIEFIRSNYSRAVRVEELAEVASMSPSSFHQHFKRVTTMSPLQYQKQIRLQEARYLLSAQGMDAAKVAFQVGYESPSQFSREYARLFGLPPISDIKRLQKIV